MFIYDVCVRAHWCVNSDIPVRKLGVLVRCLKTWSFACFSFYYVCQAEWGNSAFISHLCVGVLD